MPCSLPRPHRLSLAVALAVLQTLGGFSAPALAGQDDDAPFKGDGKTRNAADPIYFDGKLADFPTHAEPESGLRIFPPARTELFAGQRFDLRVETQLPATQPPRLLKLTVNGKDLTRAFNRRIARQGSGAESGTPESPLLLGATARNLHFDRPGHYVVEAEVEVEGQSRRIRNDYEVGAAPNPQAKDAPRRVVFFLADGTGLPLRAAARIAGKGIFEGRANDRLNMEKLAVQGMSMTAAFDTIITDSAPGMASLVTGMKQANNALNVTPDNTPENALDNPRIETIFEYMKRVHGWKIGVVTDAFLADATPAASVGHSRARRLYPALVQQMIGWYADGTAQPKTGYAALAQLSQPLDVLLGGGAAHWMKEGNPQLQGFYQYAKGGRKDVDLSTEAAPRLGYQLVRNLSELRAAPADQKLLGLFSGEFRPQSSGLGPDNLPGALDRLVARGAATIRGKGANEAELALNLPPPRGKDCGETVAACFRQVPMKEELTAKAIEVLETLSGAGKNPKGGWMLLVEQSQTDKMGHILEYDRVIYEVLELDKTVAAVGRQLAALPDGRRSLRVLTSDHAQPETLGGVVLTGALVGKAGSCFATSDNAYPVLLGASSDPERPCPLQDALGTFNDATPPTYRDANGDGFPDDPDPAIKLVLEDGFRPAYTTAYLTNWYPLEPSYTGKDANGKSVERPAMPNPARQPEGLFMTGNLPTANVTGGANKTGGPINIAPHAGDDVPVSAEGAGAEHFAGVYENTSMVQRLAKAMGGKPGKGKPVSGSLSGW
ncbi:MAG: alkaline phosphatase [Zoogloea sp.]|uniref:alkaline phosphatase n=1 Tax=Zoogloea sp. TaxID=49181 RepID=UPI003F316B84